MRKRGCFAYRWHPAGVNGRGGRIAQVIAAAAGPRLGGKRGIILGPGITANQVRVLLDGSKGPITLHARYIDLPKGSSA